MSTGETAFAYWYEDAYCVRVIDGDTVLMAATVRPFPGETMEREFVVRLLGVDTPEVRGETRDAGIAASAFTRSLVFDGAPACVLGLTGKRDVYGRWIGSVYVPKDSTLPADLATALIEAGHGTSKTYAVHLAELTEGV